MTKYQNANTLLLLFYLRKSLKNSLYLISLITLSMVACVICAFLINSDFFGVIFIFLAVVGSITVCDICFFVSKIEELKMLGQ